MKVLVLNAGSSSLKFTLFNMENGENAVLASGQAERLGLDNVDLFINSIGCPTCRAEYHKALKAYFESKKADLCPTCLDRLDRNPMRILDCKSPICSEIAKGAPKVTDYLCDECENHFASVQKYLDAMEIEYTVISSTKSKVVMETGIDDDVKLF